MKPDFSSALIRGAIFLLAVIVPVLCRAQPLSSEREAALKAKDVFKECSTCPEMVVVPAGRFMMGSPASEPGRSENEGPQHQVTFAKAFAVSRFPITFDEWRACLAERGCDDYEPLDGGWGGGKRPVVSMSWETAGIYAAWLSRKTGKQYRLLSEAEYEYVVRAGTTTPYWWGSTASPQLANYCADTKLLASPRPTDECRMKTLPVESFKPNPWGLYQAHGNIYEWVDDCWHKTYQGAPSDGSAWTSGSCFTRVYRGSSFMGSAADLRAAARGDDNPVLRGNGPFGFRVVRPLTR